MFSVEVHVTFASIVLIHRHISYCSPAHVMPLLEIVRTNKTSPQVIVDLLEVGKKIKKTPVVVGNCTGFAVNRMFFPYTQAGLLLVEHGSDVYQIDKAITKFGMPMGPFRLLILINENLSVFLHWLTFSRSDSLGVIWLSCYLMWCRLADLVGFGVAIATGMQFVENFPERTYKSLLIPLMQEDGRAGNYIYSMKSLLTSFLL